ncbi:neuroglian-like [Ruditapes philippinarum]|uniref:neuroglian-like n=1 Tax=Ruditapes philippinarum TaxID=129788 RepID=UPI00295C2961|nr:neuroglian-like [Ruditapes philippinarum]XP_060589744.1 neuroglian-like [Ruditapes philippinarum]XP_060589745.1 neuroglian-like [Ruditapes philippinarum]XP_060589746.1 neuroglian-like [Ruditapes philippinarum]
MVKLKMRILTAVCCIVYIAQVKARDGHPPQISVPQGNKWSQTKVYVRKASPNRFECQATAIPQAKYYWTVNGTAIVSDARVVAFDKETGTLTTGPLFGELHTGDYQCFASNKYGTAMTPILKIIATVANTFKGTGVSTTDLEADVSKYFKLECKDVPYSVPQWQFGWQKGVLTNGKLVANPVILTERFAIDKKGNLHFLWAEISDNGYIYGCSTVNNVLLIEVSNTQTIRLTVNDGEVGDRQPELKYHEDVQVLAGEDAELMCIFTYYSKAGDKLKIDWLRNGVNVGTGYKLNLDNVLLPDDKQNMEGEYMCEAKLGSGSSVYGRVNLKIVAPPRFVKAPETKSVPIGNDAVFNCEATSHNSYSDPPVWFVNADPLIGCHDRHFECSALKDGRSQCIKENMVCDNAPDCSDGSDESNCPGSCAEGQVWCNDKCESADHECKDIDCEYPGFLCKDKKACLTKEQVCDGNKNCADGSDERACPGGAEIQRQRWQMPSDRKRLVLPNVTLDDTLCVQCLVRNEYGSTIGDACLTVIDKIVVIKGPNSTYDVVPGMSVFIEVQATTDSLFNNQMTYKWQWYEEQTDKKTGVTVTKPVLLPPKSRLGRYIRISQNGKNAVFQFPEVSDEDQDAYNAYNALKDRLYTLIIEHKYDRVEVNFTINGINIIKPTGAPVVVEAASNLWFIALILAILILFIVVALIVCYMYRNRGGTYMLDKKEHQAGHDPAQELKDSGFHDVGRIDDDYDDDKPHADEASLSESVKPYESDDDPTEEYGGDFDVSKFNEDGSFIGLYGDKKSKYSTKEATV